MCFPFLLFGVIRFMRKNLFKWHSVSALIALVPLIVIAVTGSILVFKVEIDSLLMPSHMNVNVEPSATRQPLQDLVKNIEQSHPNHVLGTWELFDDKQRTDAAYIISKDKGEWFKVYLNQYTNQVLSKPVGLTHDITDWLVSLHYTFLLGMTGTVLGFVFAIILLFLGISGIILHRQFWKKLFTLRWQAARRIFYSDVHKFIGITASPVILILAFTGGYWNMAEVLHEVEEHSEGHVMVKQAIYNQRLPLESIMASTSDKLAGFKTSYITFPYEDDLHISFYGELPDTSFLTSQYASVITYNRDDGNWMSTYDIRTASTFAVVVDSFRRLHFGNFGGLTSKIIWCVLGLSPLWLSLTGLYFYLFRQKKFRAK
jgi:uncharacterized iron-regulated membrane protein